MGRRVRCDHTLGPLPLVLLHPRDRPKAVPTPILQPPSARGVARHTRTHETWALGGARTDLGRAAAGWRGTRRKREGKRGFALGEK
eukprot:1516336-Rhodomonas_salina.1